MSDKNRPKVDEEKIGKNPFVANLKIIVRNMPLVGQWKRDEDGIMLPAEMEMEIDPVCKLYINPSLRKEVNKLTPRAIDLLMWVCYSTDSGTDWLWLSSKRYMSERGIKSYNTFKDAVRDLVGNNFLQPTIYQGVYWINPIFFFNGSRVNKYPKNVVRK